jgi:hypothetical protein
MPTTYEACGDDVNDLIAQVMAKHHGELLRLETTVAAVFVSKTDKDGASEIGLKRNGLPAAAKIGITPLADRARGMADAKLTIDDYAWRRLNENQRAALIDHELQHLEPNPKEDEDGNTEESDDLGRPRLKLRPHDWELAGFQAVVERHGESAIEALEVARFRATFSQLNLFPA